MAKVKATDLSKELNSFTRSFQRVQQQLEQTLPETTPEALSKMAPLEQAQAQGALAYALVTLFSMYLQTLGVDPEKHPVSKEQKRVSLYLKKIDKAAHKQELDAAKKTLEVDVGAANRFISNAIPELSKEQRQKLKEASRQHQTPAATSKKKRKAEQSAAKAQKRKSASDHAAAFLDDLSSPAAAK